MKCSNMLTSSNLGFEEGGFRDSNMLTSSNLGFEEGGFRELACVKPCPFLLSHTFLPVINAVISVC